MTGALCGVVAVRDVVKTFGATRALDGITLDLRSGELLALAGANGAGKSTLIKVLSGVVAPDAGSVLIDGAEVALHAPLDAQRAGVETVHQHAGDWTIPGLSVAENLLLDRLSRAEGGRWLARRRMVRDARAVAARVGLELSDAALHEDAAVLSVSERQLVALARALARRPRLLILDEPTSTLSAVEAERLFTILRRLRDDGASILYVSHRLGEFEQLADRVAILRDGRLRAVLERPFTAAEVIEHMLGGELLAIADSSERSAGPDAHEVLRLEQVRIVDGGAPVDMTVRAGEVLGLGGAIGAGKSELLHGLFGERRLAGGRVLLDGAPLAARHPAEAIRRGVHLVPEDRAGMALLPGWSVRENATLAFLSAFGRSGLTRPRRERDRTREMIATLGVRAPGSESPIESLSGGNQQKVVLGRWLWRTPRVLLLDEPFRGVDVGARRDIVVEIRRRAADSAVIVASSDLDELLEVADRIVMLDAARVVADVPVGKADRAGLTLAMSGAAA